MQIFIPTRDRINAQFTWDNLTPTLRQHTTLVCPAEEVETHRDLVRSAVARPPVPLAAVRQWIVDELARPLEPVIMLDDDLAFFVRKSPDAHNLRPAGADVERIMDWLNYQIQDGGYVHAGLSPRQGNNWAFPSKHLTVERMNAAYCVLPEALRHYGIRFDAVDMMEDYHVVLSLFEVGEKNIVLTDAAWDQCKGSGAPGGFTHYRTKETQAAAAHRLAELHPLSVKTVEKEPKTGAGGFSGKRTDVRVQWKQAYLRGTKSPTFVRETEDVRA
jgi:hypothetical protein